MDWVPGPKTVEKSKKMRVLAPLGLVTLVSRLPARPSKLSRSTQNLKVEIKSAAGRASSIQQLTYFDAFLKRAELGEGYSYRNPYIKGPKRQFFLNFLMIFLAPGEAALAADLITAWKTLRGGCASSRLDHGFPAGRRPNF